MRKLCVIAVSMATLGWLAAGAQAANFGFASPVLVDRQLAGGEPTVGYAWKSHLLVYTAHEGTTHL